MQLNRFKVAENRERELGIMLFSKLNVTDYHFTSVGTYSDIDGWYTDDKGIKHFFEIKVRNCRSKQYDTIMFERKKTEKLLSYRTDEAVVEYIAFFTEEDESNTAIIFDLGKHCDRWIGLDLSTEQVYETEWHSTTTMGNTAKIEKEIVKLSLMSYDKTITF